MENWQIIVVLTLTRKPKCYKSPFRSSILNLSICIWHSLLWFHLEQNIHPSSRPSYQRSERGVTDRGSACGRSHCACWPWRGPPPGNKGDGAACMWRLDTTLLISRHRFQLPWYLGTILPSEARLHYPLFLLICWHGWQAIKDYNV